MNNADLKIIRAALEAISSHQAKNGGPAEVSVYAAASIIWEAGIKQGGPLLKQAADLGFLSGDGAGLCWITSTGSELVRFGR